MDADQVRARRRRAQRSRRHAPGGLQQRERRPMPTCPSSPSPNRGRSTTSPSAGGSTGPLARPRRPGLPIPGGQPPCCRFDPARYDRVTRGARRASTELLITQRRRQRSQLDQVGDGQPAAWPQYPEGRALVLGEIDHAVGDDHVHALPDQGQPLRPALEEAGVDHPCPLAVAAGQGRRPARRVHAVSVAAGGDSAGGEERPKPAPLSRSSTTSPDRSSAGQSPPQAPRPAAAVATTAVAQVAGAGEWGD